MEWTAAVPEGPPVLEARAFASFVTGSVCLVRADGPVCRLEQEDLDRLETWQMFRRFVDVHPLRLLAAVVRVHPALSDALAAEILGLKSDYRGTADARDARGFGESTIRLAENFDPPVHILRLFDRLPGRDDLLDLFLRQNTKRNLVREIIQDYYDLDESGRYAALNAMTEAVQTGLPGEELRSIVRLARYPRSEELRRQVRLCVTRMELPAGVRIEVPADLENGGPVLSVELKSADDPARIAEFLRTGSFQERLREIFAALGRD